MRIFIVGSGRTGTHLLSEIISSNQENSIQVIGESDPLFLPSTRYCMRDREYYNEDTYNRIIALFRSQNNFVCKFHPLLWLVENLNRSLNDAYFIGTVRNRKDTIRSMVIHKGIKIWYKRKNLEKLEFPNKFLGLQSIDEVEQLAMESLYEKRYNSHMQEINRLHLLLDNFHIFNYDGLYLNQESEIQKLEAFLGLKGLICPELKMRPLNDPNNN